MDFKEKKTKARKSKRQADSNLPDAELLDPTQIDQNQITFFDRSENEFMEREVLRHKLRKAGGTVPMESDFEAACKEIFTQLQVMKTAGDSDRQAYLEIENLKNVFKSHSLFNIAASLAELRVKEMAKEQLKSLYTGDLTARVGSTRPSFLIPGAIATQAAALRTALAPAALGVAPPDPTEQQASARRRFERAGRF